MNLLRRSGRACSLVLVGAIALGLVAVGCSSTDTPIATPTTTTTAAPTPASTAAPASCTNAVQSIAPNGSQPAPGQMPKGSFMEQIQQKGHLDVGVSADTLQFSARNPVNGQIEGFDVDVAHQISQAIFGDPDKINFKVITYADRIPDLQSDKIDLVADTMTINCDRWTKIDFSSEYFHAGQQVLVRSDSKNTSVDDLNANGASVCAAKGSTNIDNMAKYPGVKIVAVDDLTDCLVKFQQGNVDAITGDSTVLAGFAKQDPYASIVGGQFTDEPYGLGIKQGHPEFVQFVNQVLEKMRTDGTWASLYKKWLGTSQATPAPPAAVYGRPATT
jgi:polar amino acid transport system substrate-binding protein